MRRFAKEKVIKAQKTQNEMALPLEVVVSYFSWQLEREVKASLYIKVKIKQKALVELIQ